jgi:antitoxin (DNA-binding transcriptional repressor) of toxin-antitoxin stability system
MKSIDLAEVAALGPFLQPGSTEPVAVRVGGQAVAAIVPVASEEELEDIALSQSEEFQAILRRSQERLEREGPISADEVRRRLGL